MKLSYIVLLSDDFLESLRFWRDVMKLPLTYSDEGLGYAAFDIGNTGTALSVYSRSAFASLLNEAVPTPAGRQMYLSFPVDNVDTSYVELIEGGAVSIAKPRDVQGQQSRLAHISSPDGHIIELFGPMSGDTAPTV